MLVRLAIDFENPVKAWWENGGRELWEGLREGFEDNSVVLEESVAASWIAEAERVDGWRDGPDYAPHPITINPVADDEDVRL
ncbi:MAG: hypothetical protein V3R91_09295 [Myxococcota bacterium]|jgi:hypothetical protein